MKACKIIFFCVFIAGLTACYKNHNNIRDKLIGSKGEKYWDFIYLGKDMPKKTFNNNPKYCVLFKSSDKIIHLSYKDSLRVVDEGCDTDIKYNPDNFLIKNDSVIHFLGDDYIINLLTDKKMILERKLNDGISVFRIYEVSKNQQKEIIDCKY